MDIKTFFFKLTISKFFFLLVTISLSVFALAAADKEIFNPHLTTINKLGHSPDCQLCHQEQPSALINFSGQHFIPEMTNFKLNAIEMCGNCHGKDSKSHIVGITPDYKVPADLPLSSSGQVNCLTCHYVHGNLSSAKPMASTSFLDRLFDRDRLRKSYLLRRNNSQGELCFACHK